MGIKNGRGPGFEGASACGFSVCLLLLSQLHTVPRAVPVLPCTVARASCTYSWALQAPAVPSPVDSPAWLLQACLPPSLLACPAFPPPYQWSSLMHWSDERQMHSVLPALLLCLIAVTEPSCGVSHCKAVSAAGRCCKPHCPGSESGVVLG